MIVSYIESAGGGLTAAISMKREVSSLLSIKDAHPKLLIARTKHEESQYEGIRITVFSAWDGKKLVGMICL